MAHAAAAPPQPQYSLKEGRNSSTLNIGPWTVTSTKKPILNGKEIEAAEKRLCFPLPEMTFGNNSLILTHRPSANDDDRTEIRFDALDFLAGVAVGEGWEERVGGGVLVSMAEQWGKNRPKAAAFLSDAPLSTKPVRPHDWTYSSVHPGSVAGPSTFHQTSTHSIPMMLLARQDPILDRILFYEDVPLFEDELHDNGESILNVRIRVMPHSFFILARHFLRVDNVLFRLFDVRVYHEFGTDEVVREVSGMEAGYHEVKGKLESQNDLSPLTSANFVSQAMATLQTERKANPAVDGEAVQNTSRLRIGKPWPGLGSRVEVLQLGGGLSVVTQSLDQLQVSS